MLMLIVVGCLSQVGVVGIAEHGHSHTATDPKVMS
jgi:hypothetical protein